MALDAGAAFISIDGKLDALKSRLASEGSAVFSKFGLTGGKLMAAAIPVAAAAGLVAFGAKAIGAADDYDKATRQIAAASNTTVDQAKKITDAFLSAFSFSKAGAQGFADAFAPVSGQLAVMEGHALTAGEAVKFMGAAGDIAGATHVKLGEVTAPLAKVMQAYGLSVRDAGMASDILTTASLRTNTPVAELATGIDRMHARLAVATPSLRDVGTLVSELAEKGLTGSRGIQMVTSGFNTLLGGGDKVNETLKTLGVSVFDAGGKFVGMRETIAQLSPKLQAMSEEQRIATERALFGAGATGALDKVLMDGVGAWDANAKAVGRAGAAHAAAVKATGDLHSQLQRVGNAFKGVEISIGQALLPVLEKFVSWMAVGAAWAAKHREVMTALALVIGGALVAAVTIATAHFIAMNLAMVANPIGAVVLAVAALAAWVVVLWTKWNTIWNWMAHHPAYAILIGIAASILAPFVVMFAGIVLAARFFVANWTSIWGTARAVVAFVWAFLQPIFSAIWQAVALVARLVMDIVHGDWTKAWVDFKNIVALAWAGLVAAVQAGWSLAWSIIRSIPGWIMGALSALPGILLSIGFAAMSALGNGMVAVWGGIASWLSGLPGAVVGAIGDMASSLFSIGARAITSLGDGMMSAAGDVLGRIRDIGQSIIDAAKSIFSIFSPSRVFIEIGHLTMAGMEIGLDEGWQKISAQLKTYDPVKMMPASSFAVSVPRPGAALAGVTAATAQVADRRATTDTAAHTGPRTDVHDNTIYAWTAREAAAALVDEIAWRETTGGRP